MFWKDKLFLPIFLDDSFERLEDTLKEVNDTEFMLNTERSNEILAILTIVFTLSIPTSLISAFYGMNVNLPGGVWGCSAIYSKIGG